MHGRNFFCRLATGNSNIAQNMKSLFCAVTLNLQFSKVAPWMIVNLIDDFVYIMVRDVYSNFFRRFLLSTIPFKILVFVRQENDSGKTVSH